MPARRVSALPGILVLAVALAGLLAGCSTHSLKGTPIWDDDHRPGPDAHAGPAEDRINVWPLLYYRDPALSILWPLVTVTDEGHSVYPAYEYLRAEDHLGIGVLHPWIPAAVEIRAREGYWRVLHAWRDPESDTTSLLPLVHRNRNLTWTALYTANREGRPLFQGGPGPLFFVRDEGDSRMAYFPFPLAGVWWRDSVGGQLLPLFYHNRPEGWDGEARTTNILGVLYHNRHRSDGEDSGGYLFPLGWYGTDGDERWSTLLPFWHSWSKGQRTRLLTPVWMDWSDGTRRTRIAPPLLYVDRRDAGDRWISVPFPLVHRLSGENGSGLTVLPLFSTYKRSDGSRRFLSLPFSYEKDDWLNVMGPVYFRGFGEDNGRLAVLWPFYQKRWEGEDTNEYLFPVWYRRNKGSDRTFVSLPYASHVDKDKRIDAVPLLLSGTLQAEDGRYTTVLFPLVHHYRDDKQWLAGLLPLGFFHKDPDSSTLLSPLFSYDWRNKRDYFFNLGTVLFGHYRNGDFANWWVLGSLLGTTSDQSRGCEAHVFPLFYHSTFPENTTRWRSLLGLLAWGEKEKRTMDEVARDWMANLEASPQFPDAPQRLLPGDEATSPTLEQAAPPTTQAEVHADTLDINEQRYLLSLAGVHDRLRLRAERDPDGRLARQEVSLIESSWLFPIWYQRTVEGGRHRACVLGRLYDEVSEPDAEGGSYHRQRILWRVYHRERLGDRTSIDAFPFLAFDKGPELSKASFAGGMIEYSREDRERQLKLLWIPIRI